ncbi:DUF6531 domain-containing protein [Propionibacterium acidifaciens]|uniref:DUF6531 domain-containing protein n=2 Tax=Propionibacterium acidifaciens TaxID=556499 RepID=UPI0028E2AF62|nr:DUF6531 domain-containing protein [Propionibacterium acidifaciens]
MAEYSDKLGAYDEPVAFDDATADTLKSAATTLSATLTSQAASRTSWATTASTDFEGHYADVFDTNAKTASTDCTNIASALDDLATEVQTLKEAAQAERERRRQAKEWADRQDRENIVKKGWDWVSNGDKPPAGPAQVPLPQPHEVTTTPWSEPAPGGSGATSSARPDDLRTYSSNVTGANDTVTTQKGTLDGAIADFQARCSWCSIDTSGITAALASFGANNTNETRWVDTVAAAFEAAGGSGTISTVSDAALDASLQAAGVARTRQPVDVTAPSILGDPQTSGYADDPVNTTTGNFIEPETDLAFSGGCASLGFDRVYNSLSAGIGAFGPGWASTADQRLLVTEEGATWIQPSGRHIVFPRLGGGWDRADGDNYWLHTTGPTDNTAGGAVPTADGPAGEAGPAGGGGTAGPGGAPDATDTAGGAAGPADGDSPTTMATTAGTTAMSGARAAGDASAGGGAHASASDTAAVSSAVATTADADPGAGGGAGWFVVSDNAGGRWCFDRAGRPVSVSRGPGTRVDHQWNGDRLVGLAHERGRTITIEWNDHHTRITALTANDGRRIDYTYDPAGRLTEARTAGGGARRYTWNEAGLIATVTDPDGVVEAANTYNERGQVTSQRSRFGRTSHYTYLPGNITQVADSDGGRANTWIHDQRGRLVGMVDADGNRQSIGWDRWGNRVQVTGRDGAVTVFRYDGRGRLTDHVLETGARFSYEWDGADRLVAVRRVDEDPAGVLFAYEGEDRNPSTVTDPAGGVTRLVWDRNLLTRVVDPTGVTMAFGYDGRGDLVSAMNAVGDTARLVRDGAGRVVAAVSPLGHRTEYRYDGAGRLVSRRDPDGALWRFEHTAGGRLAAVVDPEGGRTVVEYGPGGAEHVTTDPLGRAVVMGYDDLGNTTQAILPDGSRWEFGYDGLGRLRQVTDAAGGRAELSYDACGNLTGSVDPTGVVQDFRYGPAGLPTAASDAGSRIGAGWDRLGRLTSRTGSDGSQVSARHDRCGRVVESIDEAGGVTRVERDAAGRPVRITQPGGKCFGYEYDACGRWSATVSTGGRRYEIDYDGDGRIIGETWPTGERVTSRFDACGRIIERVEPGRGRTRFGYDRCGRISWVRDTWNGRRRFGYDTAGQLVSVTDALGGTTRFEYDGSGRRVGLVDPMGGRTACAYDAVGRVTAMTDPAGRTTRYRWDAAGRPAARVDADGRDLQWRYDATGRHAATLAGGRVLSQVSRDHAARSYTVVSGEDSDALRWDELGRLVERRRDGRTVRWRYDADGLRTSMTRPDGTVTRYEYDTDERVSAVEHPGLGRAEIARDELGRITAVTAPGVRAEWVWQGGGVVAQRLERNGFVRTTRLERDRDGRVTAQTVDGVRTVFGYDAAGQLVRAVSGEGIVTEFEWDPNGRLTGQTSGGRRTGYGYDASGQLTWMRRPDGGQVEYTHDGAGRRTGERDDDGRSRMFDWDPHGFLERITTTGTSGPATVTELQTDGLGGLAQINDQQIAWDDPWGGAPIQVGDVPIVDVGAGLGVGGPAGGWLLPDRAGHDAGAGPWEPGADGFGLGGGLGLSSTGTLGVDGLALTGARAYDPATAGFLSPDPLPPVLGAGWAANPYSYAGNDPVNLSDPTGLHPLTDADMNAWRDAHTTGVAAAGDYLKDNWKYLVVGTLLTVGLSAVMGPIAGGAVAGAIVGGWQNIDQQHAAGGPIDWSQVGVSALIGGAAGLVGGAAGRGAASALSGSAMNCLGRSTLVGAASGAAGGGFAGGAGYLTGPGPHTAGGLLAATGKGAAVGGGMGAASGALSAVTETSAYGCFPAGTRILLADGSSKPIEQVTEGDRVASTDPDTGQPTTATVTATFTHHNVATLRLTTSTGQITTTAAHPFYVEGKGFTPAGQLTTEDTLRDHTGQPVHLHTIESTGTVQTVHNIEVNNTHTYHVATTGGWLLVHNGCTYRNGEWVDYETGEPVATPTKQTEIVNNGRVQYDDMTQLVKDSPDASLEVRTSNRFPRTEVVLTPEQASHAHSIDPRAPWGNSAEGPTIGITDRGTQQHYTTNGEWVDSSSINETHIPLDGWPYGNNK